MLRADLSEAKEIANEANAHTIQTLHLTHVNADDAAVELKELISFLYGEYLKDDPLFHFFYEPDIIIRISVEKILAQVKSYLDSKEISFKVYDYPTPNPNISFPCYGETPGGIVIRNLNLFLPLFHAHSVAALSLNDDDHFSYMERIIHTMWNPRGYSRAEEGRHLATLAEYKLGYPLLIPESAEKQKTEHATPSATVFSYANMFNNRSNIPHCLVDGIKYDSIFNGGWLRIRTQKGVEYHAAQARLRHLTPDWKLHFSIADVDMPRAWDIIGTLFLEKKCNMSMKMKVPDYDTEIWPEHMHGREITVYIYQHEKAYENFSQNLLSAKDQYSREFWLDFIKQAEQRLKNANIQSRGAANGDHPMGDYASLRNESFIGVEEGWDNVTNIIELAGKKYCYPPNVAGFNPAEDVNPLQKQSCCARLFLRQPTRRYASVLSPIVQEEIELAERVAYSCKQPE